jgi:hypothetical protein
MHQRSLKTRLESPEFKAVVVGHAGAHCGGAGGSYIQAMRATAIIARFFEIKAEDQP